MGESSKFPERFTIAGPLRDWPVYVFTDNMYVDRAIFHNPVHNQTNEKESLLTERQESTRKDVERFIGCVQGRFKILLLESSDQTRVRRRMFSFY